MDAGTASTILNYETKESSHVRFVPTSVVGPELPFFTVLHDDHALRCGFIDWLILLIDWLKSHIS